MGNLKFVGGKEIFEITPKVDVDEKTLKDLEDIPATVLMEVIRQRMTKFPENTKLDKALLSMQMMI
ncbi:MAG: hypothetical protein LWX08_15925 [Deltaproteobacteria bacterium]|jgi:hypothetical protein|nr:hypothetical protein [Deltaproteobacteria bacterium]